MKRPSPRRGRWLRIVRGVCARGTARLAVAIAATILTLPAAPAYAHSSFLGASPEPGTKLAATPSSVSLTFTEDLNIRLSTASLVSFPAGKQILTASRASGSKLVLRPLAALPKGAYRVLWHSVATDDGHALEGLFSFGVQVAAVGRQDSVTQSPFARAGLLRVVARALMYAALLVFAGAVMLRVLLGGRGRSWLVPPAVADRPELGAPAVAQRERVLVRDVGFLAVAAAMVSAVADALDAAGGLSLGGVHEYLLASQAGVARLAVVVLSLLAAAVAARRPRLASVPVVFALGALAVSGHANSATPRTLSISIDWLHLLSSALWLGGIGLIVVIWRPVLRAGSGARRLAVAREVLPVFGRIALPAFGLVLVTGGVSALIELGSIVALWQTDYGRVLVGKMLLVALVALASFVHAIRLRPRMLADTPDSDGGLERRHWRLLRSEPWLGLGIVVAVAVLVAFPLPPRQLRAYDEARAAVPTCSPCVLPPTRPGELAVAEQGGSDVVAAWLRPAGSGLSGTARIYELDGKPAVDRFAVLDASQTPCGLGCVRFVSGRVPAQLTVNVQQHGRIYPAQLAARWQHSGGPLARHLLGLAQARMRALSGVQEHEQVASVPGYSAITDYRLRAPDRFAYTINGHVQSITIGGTQWERPDPTVPWQRGQFGGGLPFRTRSWFDWSTYARSVYLLGTRNEAGHHVAVVALMDPGTPVWWTLYIDAASHLVLRSRLVTNGHFMTQRFSGFDRPTRIEPPSSVSNGP